MTSQLSELLEHSFRSKGNKTFLNEKNSDYNFLSIMERSVRGRLRIERTDVPIFRLRVKAKLLCSSTFSKEMKRFEFDNI